MPFSALRPSKLVSASSEQEAIDLALPLVAGMLATEYGDAVRDAVLEPFLVVEVCPGLWDVVLDSPSFSPDEGLVMATGDFIEL